MSTLSLLSHLQVTPSIHMLSPNMDNSLGILRRTAEEDNWAEVHGSIEILEKRDSLLDLEHILAMSSCGRSIGSLEVVSPCVFLFQVLISAM